MDNESTANRRDQVLDRPSPINDEVILPQETIDALEELGVIFRRIHERMKREGYTIVEGKITKLNATQNEDHHRSIGKEIPTGHLDR